MGSKLFGWSMRILFGLMLAGITVFLLSSPIWSLVVVFLSYMVGAIVYGYAYTCENGDNYNSIFIGFIWPIIVLLNWSTFDQEKDAALEEISLTDNTVSEPEQKCYLCEGKLKKVTLAKNDEFELVETYCPKCEVKPRLVGNKVEFSTEHCLYMMNPYNFFQ